MDRGTWLTAVHGAAKSDTTEYHTTARACLPAREPGNVVFYSGQPQGLAKYQFVLWIGSRS